MAAQRSKHRQEQLVNLASYNQLKECPSCNKLKSKVKESRKVFDGIRRRYQCLECDHRYTTYEIYSGVYDELISLRHKISQLQQVFADLQPPLRTSVEQDPLVLGTRVDKEIPCADCVHMKSWGCSFDLPEAETEDARGCNLFEAVISDSILT